jgi:hypothetical protein
VARGVSRDDVMLRSSRTYTRFQRLLLSQRILVVNITQKVFSNVEVVLGFSGFPHTLQYRLPDPVQASRLRRVVSEWKHYYYYMYF